MVGRVCVIGAGPSGLSVLCWFNKMKREGKVIPEIVCYEKQADIGGLWNYTWRTGTDEHGEHVHGSMYRYLWSNGPKECLEFPHYTFEQHFGKPIPSFPPRAVLFDYLKGRWNQEEIKQNIRLKTAVQDVCYNEKTDDFTVVVKDLTNDKVLGGERFDYVVVSTGHYSVPNVPTFQGIDRFPGRVMHSHDFREANEFKGLRLLLIGASYSAEDIALQCIKYGAKEVICTWRTKAMGFNWPDQISERPLVQRFEGRTAVFKDGSTAEVDVVLMCTGYLHSYPFLRENLRLKAKNTFYPGDLYKGIVWQKAANNKLLYIGVQDQAYTYTMFDVCGLWAVKLMQGEITLPDKETRARNVDAWVERNESLTDAIGAIVMQTDYVQELAKDCGDDYPFDLDVSEIFFAWAQSKVDNISTYRDQTYTSKYTGTPSPIHHTNFMTALDDSLDTFMNQRKC